MGFDREWVDRDVDFALMRELGGPMGVGYEVTDAHWEYFGGVLPESSLYLWGRFGFDGFGQGRWWFTDPWRFEEVVDAWLEGVDLPFPDQRWWCLGRSAMGELYLWGEVSGSALVVSTAIGMIFPNAAEARRMADPVIRERMGATIFTDFNGDVYEDAVTGRLIVDDAIRAFGPLGPEQMLGVVDSVIEEDQIRLADVRVVDTCEYLVRVAGILPHRLGPDYSSAAAGVAAGLAQAYGQLHGGGGGV